MTALDGQDPHPSSEAVAALDVLAVAEAVESGQLTSVEVVESLIRRIEAIDRDGPALQSVLSVASGALDEAARCDAERLEGHRRGRLHGIAVLVKDNIDTAGDLGTTAGSLSLAGAGPTTDAPLVTALREAGAVVLGKTNLSEWANFRGRPSSSGWSGAGGQTRNPHAFNRTPGGSSSGSGSAVAAGLAPLAIGTETDGSILCPASACGLVGLKPTVGLVSREGIVPVSSTQDTAGPIARTVGGVALLLDVLARTAGPGPVDGAPAQPPTNGYLAGLSDSTVAGLRVGVVRAENFLGYHVGADALVDSVLPAFAAAGAELVDPITDVGQWSHEDEMTVLCHEFKSGLDAYLTARAKTSADADQPRSLADVIAYNQATPAEGLDVFNQDVLSRSVETNGLDDPGYLAARTSNLRRTRAEGIDAVCATHRIDALVALSMTPAWMVDHVNGDTHAGSSWSQAAIAGYPSMTVPIGLLHGLPVGLNIWGPAWSEMTLLRLAAALESQLSLSKALVPRYAESVAVLA